ncbi:helix-turn-helix domain-containing protein [Patescibacteria group bacterium]|nr:helix-turn-helix domain-containing protein [Patescibacteria group bacterium]
MDKNFISTTELAKLLGISRIAVYKKIKKGTIEAVKIGRNFAIDKKDLYGILGKELTGEQKSEVDKAVRKIVKEYGETLRMLGET